jgi:integrase
MAEAEIKGHIRTRRGNKLEAVIWVDGRRVTRATGLDVGQEAEAEAILAAAIEELRAAPVEKAAAGTLREWGERWIEDRKARGKLEYVHERSHLEHFVYPTLGRKQLAEVTDVVLLDWARGLEKQRGPSGKNPGPKYIRKITATVRALFKEAVRRHVVERTPCIWEDTDLPELEANSRVVGAGFELDQVRSLVYDQRIPEDRRVLYALEFLTGMRTGEAAARRWEDWADVSYRGDLGRLVARTAYNTRHRIVKTTKTRVEKWIPVHPALADILTAWKAEGWQRFWGREPQPDDLIVPSATGKPRNNAFSWRAFRDDLVTLGIPHQRHYETRSTFINLAEGAGASPEDVHRLTHASLGEAKDLYRRVPQQWPRLCAAVKAIQMGPPPEVSPSVSPSPSGSRGNGENHEAEQQVGKTLENGRAGESNPPTAPLSTIHRF